MAERRKDIYNKRISESQYDKSINWLKTLEQSNTNRILLERWMISLGAKGCSRSRIGKLLSQSRIILEHHSIQLLNISILDLETILVWIRNNEKWMESTKTDYYRWIRQFFKWLYEESDYESADLVQGDKVIRWLRKNIRTPLQKKKVDSQDLITENDRILLTEKGCVNNYEKALINVLHEGGLRIEELLNLRLNDIKFNGEKAIIDVVGKTGARSVPLVLSVGYLRSWMAESPHRNEDNFYIWASPNVLKHMKPLRYTGAVKLIRRVFARAGVKKKCNAHNFRHSRLTINAEFMRDNVLKAFAGWSKGSRCIETYVHTGEEEVNNAILKHHGVKKEDMQTQIPIKCPNCLTLCSVGTAFCGCCGTPLTAKAHQKKENTEEFLFDALQKIMSDDKMRSRFMEFQAK